MDWLHCDAARATDAVGTLGTEHCGDYWADTLGNAGFALSLLLAWARDHPTAVWEVP